MAVGSDEVAGARTAVREAGFAFVPGAEMRAWLEHAWLERAWLEQDPPQPRWDLLAASWDALEPDLYLAAKGRQRRRRHAVFTITAAGAIRLEARQAHFQSLDYNALQGDLERWFEPVLPAIANGPELHRIIAFGHAFFAPLAPSGTDWRVEVHQFRIEPSATAAGEPTPEGIHRDGVDFVLVLMIDRHNIASGTTTIHAGDGRELGSFTLAAPFDAALVDDHRVFHGVTPVVPQDPAVPAHRDVLVVTYRTQASEDA